MGPIPAHFSIIQFDTGMAQADVINELLSMTSKDTITNHSEEDEEKVQVIWTAHKVDCSKTVCIITQFYSRADPQNQIAETTLYTVFRHFTTYSVFNKWIQPVHRN